MTVYRITGKDGASATLDGSLESAKCIADTMNGTVVQLGFFPAYFHTMSKWEAMWWGFFLGGVIGAAAEFLSLPSTPTSLVAVTDIICGISATFAVVYLVQDVIKRMKRRKG